jgi:hypothetical protein
METTKKENENPLLLVTPRLIKGIMRKKLQGAMAQGFRKRFSPVNARLHLKALQHQSCPSPLPPVGAGTIFLADARGIE